MPTLVMLPEPVGQVFETLPDLYLVLSPELLVLTASDAYLGALQLPRAALLGQPWPAALPTTQPALVAASLRQALATRQPQALPPHPYQVGPPGGPAAPRYYTALTTPVLDAQGQLAYLVHRLEAAAPPDDPAQPPEKTLLQKAEIIGQMGSYEGDVATLHFYFSDNLFRLMGYAPQSFVPTLDWLDSISEPEDAAAVRQVIEQALRTRQTYQYHRRIWRPDGQQRHLVSTGQVACDAAGQPTKLLGTVQDVTEQQQAQAEIQRQAHFIQQVADAVPGTISVFDFAEQRIVYINRAQFLRLGYTEQELAALGDLRWIEELVHPADQPLLRQHLAALAAAPDDEIRKLDYRLRHREGHWEWRRTRAKVFRRDAAGVPLQYISLNENTTREKQAEEALRNEHRRLKEAQALGHLGWFEWRVATGHMHWSEELYHLHGLAPQADISLADAQAFVYPSDLPAYEELHRTLGARPGTAQHQQRIVTAQGEVRVVARQLESLADEQGRVWLVRGTVHDVTEQVQAAAALQQHVQRLQQSEEVANLGSWEYTVATGALVWSEGLYRLLGLPPGRLVGPRTYLDVVVPADRALAEQLLRQARQGHLAYEENVRVLVEGQIKTLRVKALQTTDASGHAERLLGVAFDISPVTRLEAENLHLRLRQQQELLAATVQAQEEERRRIAESLHNGLGQLLYATKLQLDQLTSAPLLASAPELAATHQATKRLLSEAMRQTRTISHELMPGLVEEFGLETALRDICRSMHSASFQLHCLSFLDEAHPLPRPLEVVLYRLAQELTQNVVKHARATQATLEIETLPGWAVLRVEDNGQGFAPATAQAGIGLRTLHERVAQFGGTVHIDSAPAQGTHVQVRLPLPNGDA
ncbi:PAS domain-containing protein [Hymenobacter bucti]|uniref:Oxygen sensor histidine kinase NreB n=1 Tax=Hymenobacter bucti TaxID=1844114 RepID=A0ABW4QNG7_9BACT